MVSLDVAISYELKTMHATKTGKGAFGSSLFFRIQSILESAILATRNLVLIS